MLSTEIDVASVDRFASRESLIRSMFGFKLVLNPNCTHLPPSTLDLRESSDGLSGLFRQKQYGSLQGNLRDAGSGQQASLLGHEEKASRSNITRLGGAGTCNEAQSIPSR